MRRSKEEWRRLFAEHESSGLTAAAFCREHSLCPKYFSLRKRQLGDGEGVPSRFVAVKPAIVTRLNPSGDTALRVIDVKVPSDQLLDVLARLLQ